MLAHSTTCCLLCAAKCIHVLFAKTCTAGVEVLSCSSPTAPSGGDADITIVVADSRGSKPLDDRLKSSLASTLQSALSGGLDAADGSRQGSCGSASGGGNGSCGGMERAATATWSRAESAVEREALLHAPGFSGQPEEGPSREVPAAPLGQHPSLQHEYAGPDSELGCSSDVQPQQHQNQNQQQQQHRQQQQQGRYEQQQQELAGRLPEQRQERHQSESGCERIEDVLYRSQQQQRPQQQLQPGQQQQQQQRQEQREGASGSNGVREPRRLSWKEEAKTLPFEGVSSTSAVKEPRRLSWKDDVDTFEKGGLGRQQLSSEHPPGQQPPRQFLKQRSMSAAEAQAAAETLRRTKTAASGAAALPGLRLHIPSESCTSPPPSWLQACSPLSKAQADHFGLRSHSLGAALGANIITPTDTPRDVAGDSERGCFSTSLGTHLGGSGSGDFASSYGRLMPVLPSPGCDRRALVRRPSRIILSPVDGSGEARLFVAIPKSPSERSGGPASTRRLPSRRASMLVSPSTGRRVSALSPSPSSGALRGADADADADAPEKRSSSADQLPSCNVAVAAAQLLAGRPWGLGGGEHAGAAGKHGGVAAAAAAAEAGAGAVVGGSVGLPPGRPLLVVGDAPGGVEQLDVSHREADGAEQQLQLQLQQQKDLHWLPEAAAAAAAAEAAAQAAAAQAAEALAAVPDNAGRSFAKADVDSDASSSCSEEWWCGPPTGLLVREVMTAPVHFIAADADAALARALMAQHSTTLLLVDCGPGRDPGLIEKRDLFKLQSLKRRRGGKRRVTARDLMHHPVVVVDADAEIEVAAQALQEADARRAVVRDARAGVGAGGGEVEEGGAALEGEGGEDGRAQWVGTISDVAIYR